MDRARERARRGRAGACMVRACAYWKVVIAHRLGWDCPCSSGPCCSLWHLRATCSTIDPDGKDMSSRADVLECELVMNEMVQMEAAERTTAHATPADLEQDALLAVVVVIDIDAIV